MCGFIVSSKTLSLDKLRQISKEFISYRGTLEEKIISTENLYFSFKRLPIVDVSNNSNQPYQWEGHSIVFNGEIYNYKNIKRELETKYQIKFEGNSDVEVFLKGFLHFGPKTFFEKANGMWAYVIEDNEKNIYWGRDQFGIKPLYFSFNDQNIHLSSSLPALNTIMQNRKSSINKNSISTFIAYGYWDPVELGLFENIDCAIPGYVYTFNQTKKLTKSKCLFLDESLADKSIRDCLDEVIFNQIPEEVDFSIALSGGLDSNILAYTLSKNNRDFKAFSLKIPTAKNEYKYIDQTINDLNIYHEYISVEINQVIDESKNIIKKLGLPLRSSQPIYQSFLRKRASELGSKVFFTGDGADEIFGGYLQGFFYFLRDKNFEIDISQFNLFLGGGFENKSNFNKIVEGKCKVFKNTDSWNNVIEYEKSFLPQEPNSFLEYMIFRLHKHPMQYWMALEDVISLSNQIETRVPFLDQRIVSKAFQQNLNFCYYNGVNKYLLRESYHDLPNHIIDLKKKYPRPADTKNLVYSKECSFFILDFINSDIFKNLNLGNPLKFEKLYKKNFSNKEEGNADNWFRIFSTSLLLGN